MRAMPTSGMTHVPTSGTAETVYEYLHPPLLVIPET